MGRFCAEGFESSVNSEGIETLISPVKLSPLFESSVNSEGIETKIVFVISYITFESSVNSEGIETRMLERVREGAV